MLRLSAVASILFGLMCLEARSQDAWVAPGGSGSGSSAGDPLGSIQAAIDIVGPGGTVFIAPGTYTEVLLIDPLGTYGVARGQTTMTLCGSGAGVIIEWPTLASRSPGWNPLILTSSGKQGDAILWIHGTTNAAIKNIEFDGLDDMSPSTGTVTSTAVAFNDGAGSLIDCSLHNVQINAASGAQGGLGLLVESPSGPGPNVVVTGCTFYEIQKGFIVCSSNGCCDVIDTTLTGRGPTTSIAQNGIQYSFGGKGTVSGTTVDGFWWTGASLFASGGILNFDAGSSVTIMDSIFIDCQIAIFDVGSTIANVLQVTGCCISQVTHPVNLNPFNPAGVLVDGGTAGNAFLIQGNSFNNLDDVGVALFTDGGIVTGNYFNNNGVSVGLGNGQDEGSPLGNNWDGNSWSDFTTNSGYPATYVISGAAAAVDNSPVGDCPEFSSTDVAVGQAPCDVVVAQLIGSSALDIATADSLSDSLTILENDGIGGFGASTTTVPLTSGDEPSALASGDFDGAGGVDLAVAASGADAVIIVTNNGAGVFTLSTTIPTPKTSPVDVAAGDLNGSGTDDIVVAMEGDVVLGDGGLAVILDGGAPLLLPAPVGGFLSLQRVVICDLDGDLDNDVVATMAGTLFAPSVTDNLLFYENDGTGSFTLGGVKSVPQNPRGICCGDLDGDGDADIAVTAESFPAVFPGSTEVLLNGGLVPGAWDVAGLVSSGGSFVGGSIPNALVCGDLSDDSLATFITREDVVVSNFGSSNLTRFNAYLPGSQEFSATQSCAAGLNPTSIVLGHLDNDGTLDVVVANKASNTVSVALSIASALAQTFGVGCSGTNGLPIISTDGLPVLGGGPFTIDLSNARAFSPALLGLSLNQATISLGGGCTLYLQPQLILIQAFTDSIGETSIAIPAPGPGSAADGLNVFFQWFIFDPQGDFNNQVAFSNALRIKFGL